MNPKLVIFDLDKTLAPFDSDDLYPDAAAWLAEHHPVKIAIATNQGGVGLKFWMERGGFGEPGKYPSLDDVNYRLVRLFQFKFPIFACYRYQSREGKWGPVPEGCEFQNEWQQDWRKPNPGMLIQAMKVLDCTPDETLMVGDSEEDRQAAANAGCAFQYAWEFFGREKPIEG